MPKRGFVDLTKDSDPPEFSDPEIEMPEETEPRPPPCSPSSPASLRRPGGTIRQP